jgi:hypothetical protein
VELVVRWLVRLRYLADLLADLAEASADLLVGKGFDLGFEVVGLVDDWLDASDFTIIGVDETGKKSHSR